MNSVKGGVLVLGASRGLGREIAIALAAEGFAVGIGCRREKDAQAVTAEIHEASGKALALVADVTSAQAVEESAAMFADWAGNVLGLVNNAGVIEPIGRIDETEPEQWGRLLEINVVGAYNGIRAMLPRLPNGGVIVNVSSGAASRPMEGWSAYCASKAAVAMLTRSVAHEYGDRGILAYGFRPGTVDTGMQVKIRASGLNPVSQIPRADLLRPEVPAAGVVWLFKQQPSDLSGEEIDIRDQAFLERIA